MKNAKNLLCFRTLIIPCFFFVCNIFLFVVIILTRVCLSQLMARGVLGVTGALVQSPAAKVCNTGADSVTVPHRPMVVECAWDRQIKRCLVTKAIVQVC